MATMKNAMTALVMIETRGVTITGNRVQTHGTSSVGGRRARFSFQRSAAVQ
jgi:hypothetical protein